MEHPADMHFITTGNLSPTRIESDGWRSPCAGHFATHLSLPMRLAPRREASSLAVIASIPSLAQLIVRFIQQRREHGEQVLAVEVGAVAEGIGLDGNVMQAHALDL